MAQRLSPRDARIGDLQVRRVMPQRALRKVGPWVFVDHFGPAESTLTKEMDVRPHPHCGLSTVSYLFEGSMEHRDSIGSHAVVGPGEIHWMRAGHGIVHSERTPSEQLGTVQRRHGLQLWCAHADGEEEIEPRFDSWVDLPEFEVESSRVRLLCGHGWGEESPVDVTSPLIYALLTLEAGQSLPLPDHEERCVYPLRGTIAVDGEHAETHELLVLDADADRLYATSDALVAVLGGDAIGPRHIWWNLVHSDRGRLQEQAERWRRREYPSIPGDDDEFIPAPEMGP